MNSKNDTNKDLKILQQEYRNMEVNRRAFAEESHLVLRKQQQTIEKIRLENETLKNDIASKQTKISFRPVTSFEQSVIDRLYSDKDKYAGQIDKEKNTIATTLNQISELKAKVWNLRKSMGGVNAARDNQRQVEKQVRILENRLDQANVKFNKSIAYNKKLRQRIDGLRSERSNFEGVYNKLEKELLEKKKQMAAVIEQSNVAYEQRDEAQLEIAAIGQTNKKEQEAFEQQMNELGKILEEELKISTMKQESKFIETPVKDKQDEYESSPKSNPNLNSIEMLDLQQKLERKQNFEDAFRKISIATGISDVDDLVKAFIENEEQNFSLYTYANEQVEEIEKLEVQIQELKDEEIRYIQESGNDESQYESILIELDSKLCSTKEQVDKLEEKCQEKQNTIKGLKSGIQDLLRNLECKQDKIAGDVSVTDTNMSYFLGVIEQRTNEILSAYHKIKLQGGTSNEGLSMPFSKPSILGIGPTVPMGGEPLSVNPPKLADYSSDDGSSDEKDLRPLTREEVTKQRQHGLIDTRKKNSK